MKTSPLFSAVLACALLVGRALAATGADAGWSAELAAAQQASSQDTGGRLRAEVILRAVLDAARHGLAGYEPSGRAAEAPPIDASLDVAAAHAAYSALVVLYPQSLPALDARLAGSLAEVAANASAIAAGRAWGEHVAQAVLAEQSDAVFLNASSFAREVQAPLSPSPIPEQAELAPISPGRYRFRLLAGTYGTSGYVDAAGAAARFNQPGGMAADAAGNLYLSDNARATIRKVSPEGVVTTLAGTPGGPGSQDGTGPAAQFNQPSGLAVDGAGNVYVADSGNHTIRKIDSLGRVTTVAGKAGQGGGQDGSRESARLLYPTSLTIDPSGNLLVVQAGQIRKIAPDGSITTPPAPNLGAFWPISLQRVQADAAGNLYVTYLHSGPMEDLTDVLKLIPQASGEGYTADLLSPPGSLGYMMHVYGVDGAGRVFITGYGDPTYICTPDGAWQVLCPTDGMERARDYPGNDIAVGPAGEFYVFHSGDALDGTNRRGAIEVGLFDPAATDLVIVESPRPQLLYRGDNARFEVTAAGGPTLAFQWYFNARPIDGATGSSLVLQAVQPKDAGSYSVVVSDGSDSRTSRSAALVVSEKTVLGSASGTSASLAGTGSSVPTPSAGGGSIDPGMALVVLMLLAAAAGRRYWTGPSPDEVAPARTGIPAAPEGFQHCDRRDPRYGDSHE